MTRFRIEALSEHHDRRSFSSTSEPLDRYLAHQAGQDVRRMVSACFVAVPTDAPATVAGFYTLAASSVLLSELPDSAARKLPRYPAVPVARLGRLAVDQRFTGLRLGSALIWDAGQKALTSSLAAFALVVDAKDEAAAAFYRHHDFLVLGEGGLQLFRPLANFRR